MAKGSTNNPGGRPKGSKNKLGAETRSLIEKIVNEKLNLEAFNELWGDLEPDKQASTLLGLIKYIIAPVASTEEEESPAAKNGNSYYNSLNALARKKERAKQNDN